MPKHFFKISIDDSWVEYSFLAEVKDNNSIAMIQEKICKALKVECNVAHLKPRRARARATKFKQ